VDSTLLAAMYDLVNDSPELGVPISLQTGLEIDISAR
jgi:hypothetical protein